MNLNKNFSVINISENSLKDYKKCFDDNGSPKTLEKVKWQFLENPVNKQLVDIAIDQNNDKVAAIYAIAPVKFKINSGACLGAQSLDTITDIDYRGQGLFINLAKNVYNNARLEEVKFVYGFPNGNSIYGFQKKLNWKVLDPIPFLIKPISTSYFTKKISAISRLPNIRIAQRKKISDKVKIVANKSFGEEVNDIWEKFSKDINIAVKRDKRYLDWRYLAKPVENYVILHGYSKDETYFGYIIYCVKEKHGGKIGYIMEFIFDPLFEAEAKELINVATNGIIDAKADCILSWCLQHSPNYSNYKKLGFFNLPDKIRPIELHFGATSFDDSLDDLVYNRNNWYLSYSDSDTV